MTDREPGEGPTTIGEGLFEQTMGPSSSVAHLYRGEVHRMTRWRERLDRTTNWSVIVMAALLTWAFSRESRPHYLVLVGATLLVVFLMIEAHRYRSYDIWRTRVRLLQENVFAYALAPGDGIESDDWTRRLSSDYRNPTMGMPFEEAVAHRLRRVYLWLFAVLFVAWLMSVTVLADEPWPTSASVGSLPGAAVTFAVLVAFVFAAIVAFRPRTWHGRGELRNGCEL